MRMTTIPQRKKKYWVISVSSIECTDKIEKKKSYLRASFFLIIDLGVLDNSISVVYV